MQTTEQYKTKARIARARALADLIDQHFPALGDKLAQDPDGILSIGTAERCGIEACAGFKPERREDSGSYASWSTWLLAATFLGERRRTAVSA